MDSDAHLDYAFFQLSPKRSRCELFVSRNGKPEKIASGFVKPFVEHLKVAEEQAFKAAKSIKLDTGRSSNDRTWFNKATVERFVRFVSTPEILELISAFEAEISQLEGAKRIYSQGATDPFSASLGENQITSGEAVDTTKKMLLTAIELRLVSIKQGLAVACSRASSAGFTYDNVSELLHFAHYFGAKRLREACTNFISLCERYPEFLNLQHLPQSKPLPLESIDDNIVISSSSSDMSIDNLEDETRVSGKPTDGVLLQKPSCSQFAHKNAAKLLGFNQLTRPIQQHFATTAGKAVDDPISETPVSESSQQDGGGDTRRLSVQDRISLFESKRNEQAVYSKNINSNVGVKGVLAGKGNHRRFPRDVSDKSVMRRWNGASDVSKDIRSTSCSSFNDKKHGGSDSGTPTSANLQFQSFFQREEMVAELNYTGSEQSQLGPKENIVCVRHDNFEVLKDGDFNKVIGNKTPVTQYKSDFPVEQRKLQDTCASVSRKELYELSDQNASQSKQNGIFGLTDCTGLKFHTVSPNQRPFRQITPMQKTMWL